MVREVRAAGLLEKATGYYVRDAAVNGVWLAALGGVLVVAGGSWWVLAGAPAAALWSARVAFVGHDASHRQIVRSRAGNRLIGLVHMSLSAGVAFTGWRDRHVRHHARPNDPRRDPNVVESALAWTLAAAERWLPGRVVAVAQGVLFLPLLALDAAVVSLSSALGLRRRPRWERLLEGVLLFTHFTGYAACLLAALGPVRAAAFAVLHQTLFALHLGCSFAPNHKGMAIADAETEWDFFRAQVLTSRNVRPSPLTDWLLGGLNYQIEHHLFPAMPRPHLRHARALVVRHCRRVGVPYTETGALESYRAVRRYMAAAPGRRTASRVRRPVR
ncbi:MULTISPECIES: acyl-CoA desaturase [Streptomycetaceae]|uniref:fatty acid desaturase family protein n=1 Tax=Streptomyces sp. SID5468 TaxID=2690295 RepID=UPI001925F91E|nr:MULTISPECIES: acyl-CoA desaturase [Streptomycetaceae]